MRRWDTLLDGYIAWCETCGLKPETLRTRQMQLERLGSWLKRRRPRIALEDVDSTLLVQFIKQRTAFHAKSTVSGVVSTLRLMGEHLVREGVWLKNPMRWIRGPRLDWMRRPPRRIGREDLTRLWDAAQKFREEHMRHLSVAMLALLYSTGLRRGEIARLNMEDWMGDQRLLRIDGRKTGQERQVPVSDAVWRCLEAYLTHRHNKLEKLGRLEERSLFIGRQGQRVSGQSLGVWVHRLAQMAQVPLVSLHQFRHSCASDLLESGVSLPQVQQILGHAAITSTVRYLQIADPSRKEAIAKHPINEFLENHPVEERRAA